MIRELMKSLSILLLSLVLLPSGNALAQGGGSIHRSLSALEAELLAIVDQKEGLFNAIDQRNDEINKLTVERNRVQGPDRDKLNQRIEANNNQNRIANVQINRLNLTSERIRIEIDRLMRFDAVQQQAGKGGPAAPQIRAINVVRSERKGPIQVPGQGRGFNEITVYEVIFANGTRQRVESNTFVPQR